MANPIRALEIERRCAVSPQEKPLSEFIFLLARVEARTANDRRAEMFADFSTVIAPVNTGSLVLILHIVGALAAFGFVGLIVFGAL